MSLSVDVFVLDGDGKKEFEESPSDGSDLAGFEAWRKTVWGGRGVRALGAGFFPVLADGDLTVWPAEVADFLAECALLREHLSEVAPHPNPQRPDDPHAETIDQVSSRLANIQQAAERALKTGGGVMLW